METPGYVLKSAEKTADALIYTGACYFHGILVATDGTNAVTLDIYDNTAGSGTVITPTIVIPTSASMRSASIGFNPPVWCKTGIYVDITLAAGSCSYVVYYFQM